MKDSTNIIATRQVEKVLELLQDSDKTELEPISKYDSYRGGCIEMNAHSDWSNTDQLYKLIV